MIYRNYWSNLSLLCFGSVVCARMSLQVQIWELQFPAAVAVVAAELVDVAAASAASAAAVVVDAAVVAVAFDAGAVAISAVSVSSVVNLKDCTNNVI